MKTLEKLNRYHMDYDCGGVYPEIESDGDWVKFCDVEELVKHALEEWKAKKIKELKPYAGDKSVNLDYWHLEAGVRKAIEILKKNQ